MSLTLSQTDKDRFSRDVVHLICYRLRDFAKLYDVIKNERNKCVNLIQTSTQKAAEMREKIKILQNEIEILRTAVTQKDRYENMSQLMIKETFVLCST